MKTFQGKNVFLTGAASGIGYALAVQLAKAGCNLFLVDVSRDGLEQLKLQLFDAVGKVEIHPCDLCDSAAVSQAVETALRVTDGIDLLINNAGVAYYGSTEAMSQQQWNWLMGVNLLAPIQITRELLPSLLERPETHIVNMCSISGLVAGGRFAAYHTSKFGLVGFTEALRAEFGRRGLGVTAICPGPVLTKLYSAAASGRADRSVPTPPKWLSTTPEHVASVTLRAIRRNRRQVLITPLAHLLYQLKRFAPGLIDFMNQFSRSKKRRQAAMAAALRQRQQGSKAPSAKPEQSEQRAA
jgi:short-subunit dehydrogenase